MTLQDDLIICCCDAPTQLQRQQADYLCGYELMFRANGATRTYHFGGFPLDAENEYQKALSGESPTFRNYRRGQFAQSGGPGRASIYFNNRHRPPANAAALGGGSVQRSSEPPAGVSQAVVAQFMTYAPPLVADVRAALGDAFDARRRRVYSGRAAPGDSNILYRLFEPLIEDTGSAFSFAAGTWVVQFAGAVMSSSTANPAPLTFTVAANGVPALTLSGTRERRNQLGVLLPPGDERRGDVAHVELSDTLTLAEPSEITFMGGGLHEQNARGVLRVFPA